MKLPVLKLLSLFLLEGTSSFSVQSPNQSQSSSFFPQQSITFASSSSSQSNKYDDDGASVMYEWFNDLIDSTPYFERVVPSVLVPVSVPTALKERDNQLAFTIPSMNNAKISLRKHEVQGCTICIENINENDYGAICAKLYESQCTFNESRKQNSNTAIDNNQNLRQIVKDYFSKQTPHTGYDASIFKNNEKVESILLSSTTTTSKGEEGSNPNTINEILQTLQQKGYVTIDTNLKTNREAYTKLSSFLQKKTKQDTSIRSDTVAFLDINDGKQCELQNQFDVLMGMAAFLNDNLTFEECEFEPLLPATREKPLTNPRNIQAAEYGFGEYYVAHSDNLFANSDADTRSNYRLYTCILYCNENWDIEQDGGALRIYPNTAHLRDPSEAVKLNLEYEDINPSNGKLLIFDSRLVHSVEKVTSLEKKRLALTIWIMRPEDCGVTVDIWNEEKGQVDWYRLF